MSWWQKYLNWIIKLISCIKSISWAKIYFKWKKVLCMCDLRKLLYAWTDEERKKCLIWSRFPHHRAEVVERLRGSLLVFLGHMYAVEGAGCRPCLNRNYTHITIKPRRLWWVPSFPFLTSANREWSTAELVSTSLCRNL